MGNDVRMCRDCVKHYKNERQCYEETVFGCRDSVKESDKKR